MPKAICFAQDTMVSGAIEPAILSIFCSVPYGQYSITMPKTGAWVQIPLKR